MRHRGARSELVQPPESSRVPGRVFPPCVFDRPHRIVGAAPAPVPEFYLELFDRVVREMCAGD